MGIHEGRDWQQRGLHFYMGTDSGPAPPPAPAPTLTYLAQGASCSPGSLTHVCDTRGSAPLHCRDPTITGRQSAPHFCVRTVPTGGDCSDHTGTICPAHQQCDASTHRCNITSAPPSDDHPVTVDPANPPGGSDGSGSDGSGSDGSNTQNTQNPQNTQNTHSTESSDGGSGSTYIIGILVLAALGGGGFFMYNKRGGDKIGAMDSMYGNSAI